MKNKTLRNDLVVIVILFLIIGGLFFFKSRKQGQLIEITKDNQIYGYYSLNKFLSQKALIYKDLQS